MRHPSFDTWTIVFLIAAVQGFFVALVLLRWRRGNPQGNRLLAALLLLFSLTLLEYVLFWTDYLYRFVHMANISTEFPFLFGPLVWWYLRTIYEQKPLRRADLLHAAPFVLFSLTLLPWFILDADTKRGILWEHRGQFPGYPLLHRTAVWLRIAHLFAYAAWNAWYIRQQPRAGETHRWAVLFNGCFTGFSVAYASYFILSQFSFFSLTWDYHISAFMTAFIYLIAYAGYAQPAVFDGFAWAEPAAPVKYRNSGLTPEASRSLLQKMDALMENERLYRDPDLSLDTLSERLNASKHHVSQIINEHLGASFFEYINQLRIREARQLLAETTRSDLHVIEVVYAVGFNNKVSFNAAFKKATGMTPTEYRKSHGKTDGVGEQPGAVGEHRAPA